MASKRKPTRRVKGSGSIYQNKDGSWLAALTIDGRLARRRAPDRATAEKHLAALQELKRREIKIASGEQTLAAWLENWYNQFVTQRNPRPRTREFYLSMIERYIVPLIGHIRLCDLDADRLQRFLDTVRTSIATEATARGLPYSGARTAVGCAEVLNRALKLAVRRKYILDNPMDGLILPKIVEREVTPVNDALLTAFLKAAERTRLAALWAIYALMGLRLGEGLGLRWAAYDRTKGTLWVDQQVQRADGGLVLAEPKTRAGKRELPVPVVVAALLALHWTAQQAERLARGVEWKEHGLMFPDRYGAPLSPRTVQSAFCALRDKAGIPPTVTLHHLRHTVATLLDEVGATEALKQGILGHGPKNMTQHYTTARIEAMRRVLEALAARIRETEEKAKGKAQF